MDCHFIDCCIGDDYWVECEGCGRKFISAKAAKHFNALGIHCEETTSRNRALVNYTFAKKNFKIFAKYVAGKIHHYEIHKRLFLWFEPITYTKATDFGKYAFRPRYVIEFETIDATIEYLNNRCESYKEVKLDF